MKKAPSLAPALDPLEWDFRKVPPGQLEACFLYEYARESPKICEITVKWIAGYTFHFSDSPDNTGYHELLRMNPRLALMLTGIAPDLKLTETPFQHLADEYRYDSTEATAFSFLDPRAAMLVKWPEWIDGEKPPPPTSVDTNDGRELACIEINWNEDFSKIKSDAGKWLEQRLKAHGLRAKTGRHANRDSAWKDSLRQLGALRLLARYPLKKAIEVSSGFQENRDSIYSGYTDAEGRPAHQSSWDNACKGAVRVFQETFGFPDTEMPISWKLWQGRRMKNRN